MMNSSGSMDGSQSDASYRDEDFRSSDTDSLNGDGGTRNYGYPSAGVSDRCGGLSSPDSGSLEAARKEFNKNRKIIIKNIPPVRYEEVKAFLGAYSVSNISISKRARHAVATLTDGGQAEEAVEQLNNQLLMDTPVNVAVYPNECLLCIAHLPLNLDDTDFRSMASEYGAIERAFLMRSREGRSKGYAFVEFSHNKELSTQARNMLDGKRVGSCILHCDFLDTSIVSFEHLQSKCLFIDHLPAGYDNEMELRNIFSFVKTPTFFRLHTADGQSNPKSSGSFAVVEYETAEAAEETQRQGSGLTLRLQRIRVTFCLPGRSGIDLFGTLLAAHSNSSKQALLPNPGLLPGPANDSLTNPLMMVLLGQSPQLLHSFQKILQHLQTNQPPVQKPGLLGMAPNMPPNPLMNPNLQVALLAVLLAMQLQQREPSLMTNSQLQAMLTANLRNEQVEASGGTRPSLLGNPMIAQANALLQNLAMQNRDLFPNQSNSSNQSANGNVSNINVNQLHNWNQLLSLVQGSPANSAGSGDATPSQSPVLTQGQGLLGDAPSNHHPAVTKTPLLGTAPGMGGKPGLLGDAPSSGGPLGRPILGNGSGLEGEKRSLLGNGPQNIFPDSGSKENINMGPANPLLALFLEGQIRQQLETLRAGGSGSGGSSGGNFGFGNVPQVGHQHQGLPQHPGQRPPMAQQGPLPPRQPLLGPQMSHRPLANRRPPRPNLAGPGPGPRVSIHGQLPFPPHGRPPIPPPQSDMRPPLPPPPPMNSIPMSGKPYKPLLPNPNCGNMGPTQARKPGLLGEHPGAMGRPWSSEENGPPRGLMNNRENFPKPNKPEKVGLLGDAPPQFSAGPGQNNHDTSEDSMSRIHGNGQGQGHGCDDWGVGLWDKPPPTISQPSSTLPLQTKPTENFSNKDKESLQRKPETFAQYMSLVQAHNGSNLTTDNIDPAAYLQQYQQLYQQYLSQYSQVVASIYNQASPILPPESLGVTDSLLGAPFQMTSPKTPVGSKRSRPHLLPSPEPSPEGNYIGQHSQGIGGHYASSYSKKRKVL